MLHLPSFLPAVQFVVQPPFPQAFFSHSSTPPSCFVWAVNIVDIDENGLFSGQQKKNLWNLTLSKQANLKVLNVLEDELYFVPHDDIGFTTPVKMRNWSNDEFTNT